MKQVIEAIFENGLLRPTGPVGGLISGQKVLLTVEYAGLSLQEEERREEEFWKRLEEQGMVDNSPCAKAPPSADFKPLEIKGPPLSQTIIEDRQ